VAGFPTTHVAQYSVGMSSRKLISVVVVLPLALVFCGKPPKCQDGISEQKPTPDYSYVKKDIMGEPVTVFLANNPSCRFDLPDETFPKSRSRMCVVVDREYMKGGPAKVTYAGMPVQVQAHFYNDALFNLNFGTIGPTIARLTTFLTC